MKVAYLFESPHAREILEHMIIPQLEEERHVYALLAPAKIDQIITL